MAKEYYPQMSCFLLKADCLNPNGPKCIRQLFLIDFTFCPFERSIHMLNVHFDVKIEST